MKNMQSIATILITLTGLTSLNSLAAHSNGPITSGGGMGVMCSSDQGKTKTLETLDLFEAKNRYHLNLVQSSGITEQDYIADVLIPLDDVRKSYRNFHKAAKWTQAGKHLPFLNDQGQTAAIPNNCSLVQIVIFEDSKPETINIDTDYWNMLDSLNQAALIQHELEYKYERLLMEETSENTRAAVAHLFTTDATPVNSGIPTDHLTCFAGDDQGQRLSVFQVYGSINKNFKPELVLQWQQIMGRPMINKATINIEGIGFILSDENPLVTEKQFYQTVAEFGANKHSKYPVIGGHDSNWEISIDYEFGKPVKLGLYEKGVLVQENQVFNCVK